MKSTPLKLRWNRRALLFALLLLMIVVGSGCPSGGGAGGGGGGASGDILALEMDAFDGVNAGRTANGPSALIMREDLRAVARAHSEDMVARDFFSHVNPDGQDPFDRMASAGITYTAAGENIASNNFSNPVVTAVSGWMNSPGHLENILRESFTHTGMGVATDGNGKYWFTQVFTGGSKATPYDYVYVYYDEPIEMVME